MYDPASKVPFVFSVSFATKFQYGLHLHPAFTCSSLLLVSSIFLLSYTTTVKTQTETHLHACKTTQSSDYSWPLNLVVTVLLETNELRIAWGRNNTMLGHRPQGNCLTLHRALLSHKHTYNTDTQGEETCTACIQRNRGHPEGGGCVSVTV